MSDEPHDPPLDPDALVRIDRPRPDRQATSPSPGRTEQSALHSAVDLRLDESEVGADPVRGPADRARDARDLSAALEREACVHETVPVRDALDPPAALERDETMREERTREAREPIEGEAGDAARPSRVRERSESASLEHEATASAHDADVIPRGASLIPPDDHRALVTRLDLCHFQDDAPGMVFWHPRGWTMFETIAGIARAHVRAGGYLEVRTPQLLRRAIWESSGHWDAFRDAMFVVGEGADEAAFKPVSCPGHIQLVKRHAPAQRDLPLRLAELGLVHRDEAGGTLHGLMRLRQFTQDDGHIFCTEDQVAGEVLRFCRELPALYRRLGFDDVAVVLSLRPDTRLGDDAWWDRAERTLAAIVDELGLAHTVQPGGGAIYGPKLEFVLRDRRGRAWQCGTIQLDLVMPRRFDVRYVGQDGRRPYVAMLHRALFGSIERFLGILLEHHGTAWPAWLAPDQVSIVPISGTHGAIAEDVRARLAASGVRVRVDHGLGLSRAVVFAHRDRIPFVVVVGDREARDATLSIRTLDDRRWSAPLDAAIAKISERCRVQA